MEPKSKLFLRIQHQIEKKGEISPFLCIGKPLQEVHKIVHGIVEHLCETFGVDKNYVFVLSDIWDSLKISEMKAFMEKSYQRSPFAFQVFIIENYARATVEASNAALKFLEEPWIWNLIFLTSESEAGILDTILSRVQIERLGSTSSDRVDEIWRERILRYVEHNDMEIVSHVYQEKIEKVEAQAFLYALLTLHKTGQVAISDLDDLERDIHGLEKNNLLPRYVVDKHFFLLR
jgi:DNA polymerase III delta prime subunit